MQVEKSFEVDAHEVKDESKREQISRTYLEGRYEECIALVIDEIK